MRQIEELPKEQAESMREQIEVMDDKQFEEFLIKNKMVQDKGCIFCSIAKRELESYVIAENEEIIIVLELNPVSKGHVLIIPKKHLSDIEMISDSILNVAKLVSAFLKNKLKAKRINWFVISRQEHIVFNLIPVYDKDDFNFSREKIAVSDLKKLSKELRFEFETEKEEEEEIEYELPRRRP